MAEEEKTAKNSESKKDNNSQKGKNKAEGKLEEEEREGGVTMEDIKSGKAETLFTESTNVEEEKELDVVERGKFFAVISYILPLFLVPLFLKRKNKFAIFHAKQGLLLFIWYVAAWVVKCVSTNLWLLGHVLGPIGIFLKGLSMFLIVVFCGIGIYQAATGNYWRLPLLLGDWAEEMEV